MPGRLQKLSIVACTVVAWSASAGTIETLDHQKLEGRITLAENGGLSIVSAEGLRQEISLSRCGLRGSKILASTRMRFRKAGAPRKLGTCWGVPSSRTERSR